MRSTLATPTTIYVILAEGGPHNIYAHNNHGAPRIDNRDLSPTVSARIALAADRIDEDQCDQCGQPVGFHFDARIDPEQFRTDGFFITATGTILCDECGDLPQPAADACPATGSAPCPVCHTCHFNACPAQWGGNPERPDCAHNR